MPRPPRQPSPSPSPNADVSCPACEAPPASRRVSVRTARALSRWRAGLQFTRTPTIVDLATLPADRAARIEADPDLIVEAIF